MRKKELKLVVTFATTTAAMKMEKEAKAAKLPGRLIPVPAQISAGCGLAFCTAVGQNDKALNLLREQEIDYDGFCEVWL